MSLLPSDRTTRVHRVAARRVCSVQLVCQQNGVAAYSGTMTDARRAEHGTRAATRCRGVDVIRCVSMRRDNARFRCARNTRAHLNVSR